MTCPFTEVPTYGVCLGECGVNLYFHFDHTYANNPHAGDRYPITATATEPDTHHGATNTEARVLNAAPTVALTSNSLPGTTYNRVALSGRVTDPGTDTGSVHIDWGDGTSDALPVDCNTSGALCSLRSMQETVCGPPLDTTAICGYFTKKHIYYVPGTYAIHVTATDQDAATGPTANASAPITASRPAACTTSPFTDVPTTHTFCREIKWSSTTGIATGFTDGSFRPTANVTRQAMAAFLARLVGASLPACTTSPFTDVPTSHHFCKEIKWMKTAGITTGFSDGTFRPAALVTRQSMSAFLARVAGAALTSCSTAPFTDVSTSNPFCKEIKWMKGFGISTGFSNGTYLPASNVTRQAMAAFLYRVWAYLHPTG
jgi:hypothetical protein